MALPKVSVIIPVFNSEKTIRKCLDSLLAQTLTDWELILIDDGSLDASGIICDEYSKCDSRIVVKHQTNSGVSSARQAGLEMAMGEYVIHMDPDDWVEEDMLEILYGKAVEAGSDMVICDFYVDYGLRSLYSKQEPSSLDAQTVLEEMFDSIHGSCCNKLVKRETINCYKARFPKDVNYCEDVCFNIQLLSHNIKISYLNKAFYHYLQLPTSITNNYSIATLDAQKKYIDFLETYLPPNTFPVMRAKELVKKQAFKNAALKKTELAQLYPEVRDCHSGKYLTQLMYKLAFTNHYCLASIIRDFLYKKRVI